MPVKKHTSYLLLERRNVCTGHTNILIANLPHFPQSDRIGGRFICLKGDQTIMNSRSVQCTLAHNYREHNPANFTVKVELGLQWWEDIVHKRGAFSNCTLNDHLQIRYELSTVPCSDAIPLIISKNRKKGKIQGNLLWTALGSIRDLSSFTRAFGFRTLTRQLDGKWLQKTAPSTTM